MELYNLDNQIARLEALGLVKVFEALAELGREHLDSVGFNRNSGYVYIALSNGISIASRFGGSVEYITPTMEWDDQDDDEQFFDSYEDAENYLSQEQDNDGEES